MASAYISIDKLKGIKITKTYNHNCRVSDCDNIDPTLSHLNKELIALEDNETYRTVVNQEKDIIRENNTMKSIRKDAVEGLEIIFNFPDNMENEINYDKWGEANKQWLYKTFGENNVKHMIMHFDEPHIDHEHPENTKKNIHIHAFVVPIDKEEKLNCKAFINGPSSVRKLQQDYYQEVAKDFGFEPPLEKTPRARPRMSNFYTVLANSEIVSQEEKDKIKEAFIPLATELISGGVSEQYVDRVTKDIVNIYKEATTNVKLAAMKEISTAQNQSMKSSNIYYNKVRDIAKDQEEIERGVNKFKEYINAQEKSLDDIEKSVKDMDYLQRGLSNMSDQDEAIELQRQIMELIEQERRKDHKKDKDKTKGLSER